MIFTAADFEIFEDETLPGRLGKIQRRLDPKFEQVAQFVIPLYEQRGLNIFPHIAKHARRTTNPPVDTWIAFGPNRRGYKKDPHIELGFWDDRLFIKLCLLVEAKAVPVYAERLDQMINAIRRMDTPFQISGDHTKKTMQPLKQLAPIVERYQTVKSGEFQIGQEWLREDAFFHADNQQAQIIACFEQLLPLYEQLI